MEVLMADNFGKSAKKPGTKVTWRGVILVLIAMVLVVFAVQNLNSAEVTFFGLDFSIPVWLLVLGSFLLGMFLGGAVKGTARKLRKPKV